MTTLPIPPYAGCPWPIDPACLSDEWAAMDETVKARAVALASNSLQRLTGFRVTNCAVTVRPYRGSRCFIPTFGTPAFLNPGINAQGGWVNNCGFTPSNPHHTVALPAPVGRIDEVRLDGVVLPETDYHLYGGNRLAYDGSGVGWPLIQDISKPDTEVGTFSVTYINGYPPDGMGAYAAGILASEFAKACSGTKCKLPAGVTSIVRQGVSMDITTGIFPDGKTGIREVDAYIALWNPRGVTHPTTIWSP